MVAPESLDAMTWDIGDTGFLMQLSPQVPDLIQQNLSKYLERLLGRHRLTPEALDFWAVHPGGRQILDKVKTDLALPKALLTESYEVLRRYGNMSSPTILFILKQIMDDSSLSPSLVPRTGVAVGFGPGLSIEGALFQQFARGGP
jgi:predicted naringenin-chalcone synthase